jgi:Arc/MetJ-type ribon-helix-helix transcriptional regulator
VANKTERITVRVTKHHLDIIDALVDVGQIENRSLAIRQAIREFVERHTPQVSVLVQKKKEQDELKQLAAQVRELREFTEK